MHTNGSETDPPITHVLRRASRAIPRRTFATRPSLHIGQESLEEEKQSKEALSREAGQVRALLEEEKARLETERKRANDEAEARCRLESLLAAEKKKEEDMVRAYIYVVSCMLSWGIEGRSCIQKIPQ